ncbi:hypothetical protein M5M_03203 [Simiduia agarivorans SA1 = DSM 21679]|uniref:Uncharacterized protein n=1 Tax=Simiduia agarivorans (strain DSM 21679 / JCM 13881 / BCRC 17597 / SA1) TaxID=1117647 RepID=R9S5L4_SIMAS|nr:hypothetical protein M5M_03203 [Simiduia agarivorans SA1 = DSM 21679]
MQPFFCTKISVKKTSATNEDGGALAMPIDKEDVR